MLDKQLVQSAGKLAVRLTQAVVRGRKHLSSHVARMADMTTHEMRICITHMEYKTHSREKSTHETSYLVERRCGREHLADAIAAAQCVLLYV